MNEQLLHVEHLRTSFKLMDGGTVHAVNGVSLTVKHGEIVGLVGESGCGKSMTALSIMRLVPPPGKITDGSIMIQGRDLAKLSKKELAKVRGKQIAMVFQDPLTFLNPVLTVGKQIREAVMLHTELSRKKADARVLEALRAVKIAAPERIAKSYPFELSGGMRQRVLIAMAICCDPELIIADEPTTALDVTVQAQILELLKSLVREKGISMILITHDMGIVADICDRIYVMYASEIVESGSAEDIFYHPAHPYTKALLRSVLTTSEKKDVIDTIPGVVPDLLHLLAGCNFSTRCAFKCGACDAAQELVEVSEGHCARCHRCRGEE